MSSLQIGKIIAKWTETLTSIILKSDNYQNEWVKIEKCTVTNLSFTKPHSTFTHYVKTLRNSFKIFVHFGLVRQKKINLICHSIFYRDADKSLAQIHNSYLKIKYLIRLSSF